MIYQLGDKRVNCEGQVFIAPNATLVGDISVQSGASIWFNTVVRGDNDPVVIGADTNIQESCVLHTDDGFPIQLGTGVTVGHGAVIHGCQVGDYSLIGIGAIILNGAIVGRHCLIGANALIPEGMCIPDGSLVLGSPGKVKRTLTDQERAGLEASARHYVEKGALYRSQLKAE